jgi:farnesyl diphosphate synthase
MRYAVLGGGKRFRPRLAYASAHLIGISRDLADFPAVAVEFIHAFSLIHDDLPAMDNDDYRRGRPSCHRAFGEAIAILAGDALQARAFAVLNAIPGTLADPAAIVEATRFFSELCGSTGLIGGQTLDLDPLHQPRTLEELTDMHERKTGALIRAAVLLPCLLTPHRMPDTQSRLDRMAQALGLAFQIRDDILDATADPETLGRTPGGDASRGRATFVTLLGLDDARRRLAATLEECRSTLAGFGERAGMLETLVGNLSAESIPA